MWVFSEEKGKSTHPLSDGISNRVNEAHREAGRPIDKELTLIITIYGDGAVYGLGVVGSFCVCGLSHYTHTHTTET